MFFKRFSAGAYEVSGLRVLLKRFLGLTPKWLSEHGYLSDNGLEAAGLVGSGSDNRVGYLWRN